MATTPGTPKTRPPIVAVVGHVDHGKTTLLDYIRKANVAAKEAGGITQSIGAYEIVHAGKKITFIDTPGHEAFTKMRTRGANAADLAILVVAADEGVKPQTVESIRILKETKTLFVVAITKTDKNNADLERVKNELTANDVLLEGYGGHVSYQPVSAKSGEHVNELLDLVLLTAELEGLTYDPVLSAEGYILEAKMDPRRGLEATVIVTNGTLRQGEPIATATAQGKVKIMEDHMGKGAKAIEPSAPALIIGFENLPQVGESFFCGEKAERELAPRVPATLAKKAPVGLPSLTEKPTLNVVVKAQDAGSLEALVQIVSAMGTEAKPLKILSEGVGDVNDNDVKLAISAKGIVIAFKNKVDKAAKMLAETNAVPVIGSQIIYELVKAVEDHLLGKAVSGPPGVLEILAVFNQKKLEKQLVGGKVVSGMIRTRTQFDIERAGAVVGTGRITSLQTGKKETSQVSEGNEAGFVATSPTAIAVGDRILMHHPGK